MSKEINVLDIMAQIRSSIEDEGRLGEPLHYINEAIAMDDFSSDELENAIDYLFYNHEITAYEVLQGNPLKMFIKRVVRRLVRDSVLPVVAKQNELNKRYARVAQIVDSMRNSSNVSMVSSASFESNSIFKSENQKLLESKFSEANISAVSVPSFSDIKMAGEVKTESLSECLKYISENRNYKMDFKCTHNSIMRNLTAFIIGPIEVQQGAIDYSYSLVEKELEGLK